MILQMAGWHGLAVGVFVGGGGGLGHSVLFTCHLGAITSHDSAVAPLGSLQSFDVLLSHLPSRYIVKI